MPGQGHAVVSCDMGHVPALFEQIINNAKYCIINNLAHSVFGKAHLGTDLLMVQAGKADDHAFLDGFLPGKAIRDLGVQGLADDTNFDDQDYFSIGAFRVCRNKYPWRWESVV